ncbi:uncharacterized protein BDV14DRAFT_172066 [Aspergillus stella-maris]|uniref:uncharacterized protein n=1 Tax=Aspergillus stella-maris TaxID=1810926 RepID=UPI003CCD0C6F
MIVSSRIPPRRAQVRPVRWSWSPFSQVETARKSILILLPTVFAVLAVGVVM